MFCSGSVRAKPLMSCSGPSWTLVARPAWLRGSARLLHILVGQLISRMPVHHVKPLRAPLCQMDLHLGRNSVSSPSVIG